ncbi:hypothetical protein [Streptosporangium sp. NPDC051022]|uniref:hypothetical protein n=1 Tax=Streptosporangium sp. NPDC051022 TaxID=3155752 RepID=UPI003446FBAE
MTTDLRQDDAMETLDDLLEPLLGLDGRPAPFAGPLRDWLTAVAPRLDAHLEQLAAQTPTGLYERGQDLLSRFRLIRRVPGQRLHQAVVAELADPASPLRVPLWIALGELAGRLLTLLHGDGPQESREEESRLVLGLVTLLLGLTHPQTRARPEDQVTRAHRRWEETRERPPGEAREDRGEAFAGLLDGTTGRDRASVRASAPDPTRRQGDGDREEADELTVRLRDEYDRLYQDTVVYLGEPDEAPTTAERLWIGLHVACLRLPDAIAASQREYFAQTFAGGPGEGIVPPLPAVGFPGLGGVQGPDEGRWRSPRATQMYELLITMFAVADLDPGIYHGLDELARDTQTPIRLDRDTRRQYRERALSRLRQLDGLPPGDDLEIRYLAWVDEAVSSFFPLPLPAPDSWWAERYRRSRGLVLEAVKAAGGKVDILDGRIYDRALRGKLSGTQMILPVEESDVDRVLWTLRLPWEFNGTGDAGRVVYGVRRR